MSRLKGSTAQGRGGRGEMKQPEMMMMDPSQQNDELQVIPVAQVAPVPGRNRALQDITDKISRALQDMEGLYDEMGTEDEMLNEISEHANSLEGGEMKVRLKSFINRYKEMSGEMKDASEDKENILASVADWFCAQQLQMDTLLTAEQQDINESSTAHNLLSTKVGFGKLKRMQEEMDSLSSIGGDIEDLRREKMELEKDVMENFKKYNENAEREGEQLKREAMDSAAQIWKHAADEVCQMLHNVRDEGQDYLYKLEKEVTKMGATLDKQSAVLKKMEAEALEYKLMERHWKNDSMEMMTQLSKAKEKVLKLQKEVKKARDAELRANSELQRHGRIPEDDDHTISVEPAVHGREQNTPMQNEAKLMSYKKQLDQQHKDNEALKEKVEKFEQAVEEKDDQISQLEHDKNELLHQMKQSSVRPNTRRLSTVIPDTVRKLSTTSNDNFNGSVLGVSIKAASSEIESGGDCKCHCHTTKPVEVQPTPQVVKEVTSVAVALQVEEADTAVEVKEELVGVGERDADKAKILVMEKQLKKTGDLMASLHAKLDKTQKQLLYHQSLQKETPPVENERPTVFARRASVNPALSVLGAENMLPVHEPPKVDSDDSVKSKTSFAAPKPEPIKEVEEFTLVNKEVGQKKLCHRAMLTDPALDPLSSWTQSVQKESTTSWRPPMPPLNWVNFDPMSFPDALSSQTSVRDGGQQSQLTSPTSTIGLQMLKGAQPADVHSETVMCSNFVENQWKRMAMGIRGFVEYTNSLVDREGRLMSRANKKLRKHLSLTELNQLEKALRDEQADEEKEDEEKKPYLDMYGTSDVTAPTISGDGKQTHSDRDVLAGKNQLAFIEDKIKQRIIEIGEAAIATLKRTNHLVNEALKSQHKQYEHIFMAFNNKPRTLTTVRSEELIQLDDSDDEESIVAESPLPGEIRKSASNSSVGSCNLNIHGNLLLEQQTSHVKTRQYSLIPEFNQSALPDGLQDKAFSANKELKVSLATIPKKGNMFLATSDNVVEESVRDHAMPRRRVKPSPVNHSQLKNKINNLLHKTNIDLNVRTPRRSPHKVKIEPKSTDRKAKRKIQKKSLMYELSNDYFGEYTLSDISKGAEEMEMTQKRRRSSMAHQLDSIGLPHLAREVNNEATFVDIINNITAENNMDSRLPPIES